MKLVRYLAILSAIWGNSQPQWQQVSNIFTNIGGERYDDVFFLDEQLGWAANGSIATVYKTTDGGLTWTQQLNESELGASYYFRNIEFINESIGFLGTLNGEFYKTIDGGENWNEVQITPNPPAICGLDVVGTNVIYGCGAYFEPAYIIKSTNGGLNWSYIDMSSYATALVEIAFIDELNGYASGRNSSGGLVLKTTDGGLSWTEIYNTNVSGDYVWKLQILESNQNVLFGAVYSISPNLGRLIKSLDGGNNWSSFNTPQFEIEAVGFISENHGWMGGDFLGIYETTDGGSNWSFLNVGGNLNRFQILNSSLAYAAGYSIYKFTDETLSLNNFSSEETNHLTIQLSKNPVDNFLIVFIEFESSNNLLIELYDSTGRYIKKLSRDRIDPNSSKTYSFDVGDLSAGTYILDFHSNEGRTTKKFIKL